MQSHPRLHFSFTNLFLLCRVIWALPLPFHTFTYHITLSTSISVVHLASHYGNKDLSLCTQSTSWFTMDAVICPSSPPSEKNWQIGSALIYWKTIFLSIGIFIIQLKWSGNHLIFIMGIPIQVRCHPYIQFNIIAKILVKPKYLLWVNPWA